MLTRLLKEKLASLPGRPGVYLFRDREGRFVYIGKAKSLRNRVRSYFTKAATLDPSKTVMVSEIADVETILTNSEIEALLLEANLIKRNQPAYNVLLKDDKSFVYVKITLKDPFPKIETTRRIAKDGSRYFGPYTSAGSIYETLKLLKKIFPYRSCDHPPDEPCFEYELGRCAGHGDEGARKRYRIIVENVMAFLRGETGDILKNLRREMKAAAKGHEFEKAAKLRDRIRAVETVIAKQTVTSPRKESFDVVGLSTDRSLASLTMLIVRGGKLIDERNFLLGNVKDQSAKEVLRSGLEQYYSRSTDHPKGIFVPMKLTGTGGIIAVTSARLRVPFRGRKRQLLNLARENAEHRLRSAKASWERDEAKARRALDELRQLLGLGLRPNRIEAFDISKVSGEHPVGSMIVFRDGLPSKNEYRKFRIKTVRGANDPGMMVEILRRRFEHTWTADSRSAVSRTLGARQLRVDRPMTEWPVPDLIILDGGPGQLGPVLGALKTIQSLPVIVAMAKGGHAKPTEMADRERIFLPDRRVIKLPNPSDALFLLERLRDEAHRFAIGYFRSRHRKAAVRSALDDVRGLGPSRKRKLLRRFGSVKTIHQASIQELAALVGQNVAEQLKGTL